MIQINFMGPNVIRCHPKNPYDGKKIESFRPLCFLRDSAFPRISVVYFQNSFKNNVFRFCFLRFSCSS